MPVRRFGLRLDGMFSLVILQTRGDILKYAIVDALGSAAKIVRGLRQGLTVSEREAVAEQAVTELRQLPDDPWN